MEKPTNDDLADALTKLASGDIAPSEELPPSPEKPTRSASPTIKPIDMPEAEEEETPDEETEDEELVMTPEDMVRTPRTIPSLPTAHIHRTPLYQTIKFRQTLIPILLTCGLLTVLAASLKFLLPPDSIFSDLPIWLPLALFVAGLTQLALAIINMLAVKNHTPS